MLVPVLHSHPRSKSQCEALAKYSLELDGTKIVILNEENEPNLPYPLIGTHAFHWVANQMKGKQFVWMEADSPPLKKGWLKGLEAEYEKGGKPFMLTSDTNPPHDLICGIGVYDADAAIQMIPTWDKIPQGAWDGWMFQHLKEEIHFTPLIQHSYGIYNDAGKATMRRFPEHQSFIRKDALIFHKDHHQDLIHKSGSDRPMAWRVGCAGDIGDACILLGVVSQIPGLPHEFVLEPSPTTKMKDRKNLEAFYRVFSPLAKAQPYVSDCRIAQPNERLDWHSGGFRGRTHSKIRTLFDAHRDWLAMDKGIGREFNSCQPWLTAEPDPRSKDRIIIARSERYHNNTFPWKKAVEFYGERLIFIGLPHEHQQFCREFGDVEFQPTKDMLEVAQLIQGSLLFIGNQSSPMAVAEGLKHPSIQETCDWMSDCIYKRDNAQYCYNGEVTLPGFDKEDLHIPAVRITPPRPSTLTSPPGQWQYGPYKSYAFGDVVRMVRQSDPSENTPDLEDRVAQANVMRCPDFFLNQDQVSGYKRVEQARLNAGYPPRDFRAIIGM